MTRLRIPAPVRRWLPRFWLVLLAIYILAGTAMVPFHGDESTTLWMSRDFHYLLSGDFSRLQYNDPPPDDEAAAEQHMRLVAAPLTRYLYGITGAAGGYDASTINEQWVWGAGWDWNQANGHAPPDDLLNTARFVSALFTAGGVVLLFSIGRRLAFGTPGGVWIAYLASLYYALNPALLLNGRRAMMEGPALFFSLLAVLSGILLLQKRTWWAALLFGVAAGLAVAAKHTNLVVVIAVFGACGLLAVWYSTRSDDIEDDIDPATVGPHDPYFLLVTLSVAGLLALVIFFVLNPVIWDAPVDRIGQIIEARAGILDAQAAAFGTYDGVLDQVAGWLRQVFIVTPQYYEAPDWAGFIGGQITDYAASGLAGVSVGGSLPGAVVIGLLLLAGLWALIRAPLRVETRLLVITWVVLALIVPLVVNPFEWQRYYLLAYPAVGLLTGMGVVDVWRRVWLRLRLQWKRRLSGAMSTG